MKLRKYIVVILFMTIFIHCHLLVQAEYREMQFGEYPQTYIDGEKEPELCEKLYASKKTINNNNDCIVEYRGNRYLYRENEFYKYEPITWIVISEGDGRVRLVSKYVLDNHTFGDSYTWGCSWEESELRKWCNACFLKRAFTKEEIGCMYLNVVTACNWGKNKALTTEERVSILSHEKVEGLPVELKQGYGTDYSGTGKHNYYTRCTSSYMGLWNPPIEVTDAGEFRSVDMANCGKGVRPYIALNEAKALEVERKKEESKTKDLQNANISLSQTSYKFNGNKQTPSVKVTYDSKKLTSGGDYTVTYKNNRYVGTAEVQIKGTGSYTGTVTKKFKIVSPGSVNIKFDKNTKSRTAKVSKSSIKVSRGMQYGKLPTATMKGYKFAGWYTAKKSGKKIESKSYVENNPAKTLYAGWKRVTYKIQYNCDGGKNVKANPASYTIASKKITLQKPSRTGYIFAGWYNAKGKKVSAIPSGSTGDITLKAKWTPIKYKVSFKNSNTRFEKAMSDMTMVYGKKYTLPKNSYKSQNKNLVFVGWNTRKDGKGTAFRDQEKVWNLTSKNNRVVILYAQFANKNICYSIRYNLDGGNWSGTKGKASYTCTDKKYTLPKPVKIGYTFVGWKDAEGNVVTNIPQGSIGHKKFTAKWKPITYTMQYDSNGASGSMGKTVCSYGKSYNLAANGYTNNGKRFRGWKDNNGTIYADRQEIKNLSTTNGGTIVLKAIWGQLRPTLQIAEMGPVRLVGNRDFLWPVKGRNLQSCFYDQRNVSGAHPYGDHFAIDITDEEGADIMASYDGEIVAYSNNCPHNKPKNVKCCGDGFGNYVVLKHTGYIDSEGNSFTLYTRYSHMSSVAQSVIDKYNNGNRQVKKGEIIGYVGSTGSSQGYHVDFQILDGDWNNRYKNSLDPFSNQLLDVPGDIYSWDECAYKDRYMNEIKRIYATY